MAKHLPRIPFDKPYFKSFFRRWHREWGSSLQSFVYVRYGSSRWELHFPDEDPHIYFNGLSKMIRKGDAFGLVLRAWRMSHELSQKQAAEILGIKPENLCALERGRRQAGRALRNKIENRKSDLDQRMKEIS